MAQISVIVPVYNVEKYLHRCVDSILTQTFFDFELILVDDGSPDKSGVICDEYAAKDSRVRVIHQKNKGPATARNTGIDWVINKSNSNWIAFVDSDDWIHQRYFEMLLGSAIKYNATVCMCNAVKVDQYNGVNDHIEIVAEKMSAEKAFVMNRYSMTPFAKVIHRTIFEKLRFPDGKFAEDIFTMYRAIFSADDAVLIDAPLYYYYQNAESVTNKQWSPKKLDEINGLEEMLAFFKEKGFNLAFGRIAKAYCYVVADHIRQIQNSKNESYSEYEKALRIRIKRALREYRSYIKGSFREKACLYESAYPMLMNLYWQGTSLRGRIKLLLEEWKI